MKIPDTSRARGRSEREATLGLFPGLEIRVRPVQIMMEIPMLRPSSSAQRVWIERSKQSVESKFEYSQGAVRQETAEGFPYNGGWAMPTQ